MLQVLVSATADGKHVVTGSVDCTAWLWSMDHKFCIGSYAPRVDQLSPKRGREEMGT